MNIPTTPPRSVWFGFGIVTLILAIAAIVRHLLFQSTAYDLGIFDHGIYLISQGQIPFIQFRGLHLLGDHAALIFYPLALFYWLYPSVYWLFILQAIALALGGIATWHVAKQIGLGQAESLTMAVVYWLYPLVFNINLFDFHPEVLAVPALFWLVWSARAKHWGGFVTMLVIILSTKAVLSLTIAMVGIWLIFWEKRRIFGAISLALGTAWFIIASKIIIPAFSGEEAAAVGRYAFLGNSVGEIALNVFLKPQLVLGALFTPDNFFYLLLLIAPVIWGIWGRAWALFIPAIPTLFLNLITDYQLQKDLIHQYSLPIIPFLLLV
ncbi:MAG: hypothetical protein RLZZ490_1008, partial [Cyanobacteriota bacterium]